MPKSNNYVFSLKTLNLWHARLGHANFKYLFLLFPSFKATCKDHKFQCVVCELSKHTRSNYIPRISRAPSIFDLIHSDVWGPSPVTAFSGHRYYVTFIDDHSRCTWVYLLKRKSDVLPLFTQFLQMVKTQFRLLFAISVPIIGVSTFRMHFVLNLMRKVSWNNSHIRPLLNKMV